MQQTTPHRRYNPLSDEWVLVSPHRGKRPWQGQAEQHSAIVKASYQADCFLCPGNQRIAGEHNPDYQDTFVFKNDFSALLPDNSQMASHDDPLLKHHSVCGESHVICYSPDHSKTLPLLTTTEIERVVTTWAEQISTLGKRYVWVQAFENKGEIMGCSQPHPHGQIWASDFVPNEIATKDHQLQAYYQQHGTNLLLDYVQRELSEQDRVVVDTEHWLAVVPYWAKWPFETMLLPKQAISRFDQLSLCQRQDLAVALKELTTRYDNLFECSFPYSMGWHFAPFERDDEGQLLDSHHWQLHAIFYPPLLRSATIKKFMVGYEMLAESQRDITPEQAASMLQAVSDVHYLTSAEAQS